MIMNAIRFYSHALGSVYISSDPLSKNLTQIFRNIFSRDTAMQYVAVKATGNKLVLKKELRKLYEVVLGKFYKNLKFHTQRKRNSTALVRLQRVRLSR